MRGRAALESGESTLRACRTLLWVAMLDKNTNLPGTPVSLCAVALCSSSSPEGQREQLTQRHSERDS